MLRPEGGGKRREKVGWVEEVAEERKGGEGYTIAEIKRRADVNEMKGKL